MADMTEQQRTWERRAMQKPHLAKLPLGEWECYSSGHYAIGASPMEAYARWWHAARRGGY